MTEATVETTVEETEDLEGPQDFSDVERVYPIGSSDGGVAERGDQASRNAALELERLAREGPSRITAKESVGIIEDMANTPAVLGYRQGFIRTDAAVEDEHYEEGKLGVAAWAKRRVQTGIAAMDSLLDDVALKRQAIDADPELSQKGKQKRHAALEEKHVERLQKEALVYFGEDQLNKRKQVLERTFKVDAVQPDPAARMAEGLEVLAVLSANRSQGAQMSVTERAAQLGSPLFPALLRTCALAASDPQALHSLVTSCRIGVEAMRRSALLADEKRASAAVELYEIERLRERLRGARVAIEKARTPADLAILSKRWEGGEA